MPNHFCGGEGPVDEANSPHQASSWSAVDLGSLFSSDIIVQILEHII